MKNQEFISVSGRRDSVLMTCPEIFSFIRDLGIASVLFLSVTSCGYVQSSVEASLVGGASDVVVTKIRPVSAKPSEVVSVVGSNFSAGAMLKAMIPKVDGTYITVPLAISDRNSAQFVMPEGAGLGLKSILIVQGQSKTVAEFGLVSDQVDNKLPILIDDAAEICSTKTYIDRNGDTMTGTKNCAASGISTACSSEGELNCVVDGSTFKAVAAGSLIAENIKSGVTIAGVSGVLLTGSYSSCASAGAQGCVATGAFFAGTVCGTDGSACYLPIYDSGTQNKKAIDFSVINSAKMLSTLTISGVTGSIASQSWDLQNSFPGIGYYTSITNTPATSTYTGTLFGNPGTAILESHSSCAADGVTGCVTTASYKSANMTSAATTNIKSGVTIAGVAGSYTGGGGAPVCGFGGNLSTSCTLSQFDLSAYPLYATFSGGGDPVVYGSTLNFVNSSTTTNFNNVINYAFKANETRWFKIPYTGCSTVEDNILFSATSSFTAKVYDRDLINNTGVMGGPSAKGSYPYSYNYGGSIYYADLTHLSLIGWACDAVANSLGGTSYQYVLVANGAAAQTINATFQWERRIIGV